MRRRGLLRNVSIAYPGVLGVTTEKGQQDVKPNVLDAPTESYEIMLLRWQTGVFEVGAPPPEFIPDPAYPAEALILLGQLFALGMDFQQATELALQMTTGIYSSFRLELAGMPVPLAMYLAQSLDTDSFDETKGLGLGLLASVAEFLANRSIGSDTLRSRIDGRPLRSRVDDRPLFTRAA